MASRGLNVICLISGGKDSLFSILHCMAQGHKIVAIANLFPKDVQHDSFGDEVENEIDTDSFMYQTVGHSIIGHYTSALGLPLFRRPIFGTAVDQSLNYSPFGTVANDTNSDEAEDLYLLLKDVLKAHPESNAVSCGAILSTYQRMRVESVALRLNLIPLAYLWQFPYLPPYGDEALLDDMQNVGQHAIIIKVASGGLDSSFLGMNVADPLTMRKLKARMDRFGRAVGALIGEGGEFETLAIEGPKPLWKKKIVAEHQVVVQGDGGSEALHLTGIKTEDIDGQEFEVNQIRIPDMFDVEFCRVLEKMGSSLLRINESVLKSIDMTNLWSNLSRKSAAGVEYQSSKQQHVLRYSNITGTGETAQAQMDNMVQWLINNLKSLETIPSVTTTLLVLRDMKDFQAVNKAYGRMFSFSLPPSRVTICCGDLIPKGKDVVMSLTLDCRPQKSRQGIHVQSRSYWAPANIGPYSQAIVEPLQKLSFAQDVEEVPSLVHMAGQIPLVPGSMDLPTKFEVASLKHQPSPFQYQAVLSLQHLWRVGRVMNVSLWTGGLAFLVCNDPTKVETMATQAMNLWKDVVNNLHDEWTDSEDHSSPTQSRNEENYPVSETDFIQQLNVNHVEDMMSIEYDSHNRPKLPDFSSLVLSKHLGTQSYVIPCFVALVTDLPRNSPIEWWSLGFSSTHVLQSAEALEDCILIYRSTSIVSGVTVTWIEIRDITSISKLEELAELQWALRKGSNPICTVYLSNDEGFDKIINWNPIIIPCRAIWSDSGRIDALIVLISYPVSQGQSQDP